MLGDHSKPGVSEVKVIGNEISQTSSNRAVSRLRCKGPVPGLIVNPAKLYLVES